MSAGPLRLRLERRPKTNRHCSPHADVATVFPIQGRQSTRQLLWIAVSFPRGLLKPQLFIASTRQIDWTRISANNDEQRKIQLKIPGEASRSGRYFNNRQLFLLRSNH